jgi:lactate dehydrogenase-like 2-hydroxyacid dehydrogenase
VEAARRQGITITNVPSYGSASVAQFVFALLLELCNNVKLHSPLSPETRGMINAKTLRLMKPAAFLINTSRGPLVVEQDLADALNAGRIAGAALDVLSTEPPSGRQSSARRTQQPGDSPYRLGHAGSSGAIAGWRDSQPYGVPRGSPSNVV